MKLINVCETNAAKSKEGELHKIEMSKQSIPDKSIKLHIGLHLHG